MKIDILKKLIKDAVKEAIQDELKDILLEAVRSNKQPIRESYQVSDDRTLNFNSNQFKHMKSITTSRILYYSPVRCQHQI